LGIFISAVILAAGQGTRIGRQKLLLELGEKTIIEIAVSAVLGSRISETVVVLGHQSEEIAQVLKDLPVKTVFNPDYRLGQSTSLISGIKSINSKSDAFLVVLGDQPFISSLLIDQLIQFYEKSSCLIARPQFQEIPGHPVLFNACLIPELLNNLKGDIGARELIARHQDQVSLMRVKSGSAFKDIDTPGDYQLAKEYFLKTRWRGRRHPDLGL